MNLVDLSRLLSADLARYLNLPVSRDAVQLEGDGPEGISVARIDLTGATLDPHRILEIEQAALRPPDVFIGRLELTARPLLVEGARVWLECNAERVGLALSGGPPRFVTLEHGTLQGRVDRQELETAAETLVREIAAGYGVRIGEFRMELESPQPHVLGGRAWVRAGRRLLVTSIQASVEVAGSLEVFPGRGLALRDVTCRGEGPLGIMVSKVLAPRLQRLAGAALTLPIIPGHIVQARFELGETVAVQAELSG